jgi:hypothetical protein
MVQQNSNTENKEREYWVDFGCWEVTATSMEEANKKVFDRLAAGENPDVTSIELKEDDEQFNNPETQQRYDAAVLHITKVEPDHKLNWESEEF